jgi:hypothetical protein
MSHGSPVPDPPRTLVESQRLDQPTFHLNGPQICG